MPRKIYDSSAVKNTCDITRNECNFQRESGAYRGGNVAYYVEVYFDEKRNYPNAPVAVALAMRHPDIPQEGSRIDENIPLLVNSVTGELVERFDNKNYLVKVQCSLVSINDYNGVGMFSTFIRATDKMVETTHDMFGRMIEVEYQSKKQHPSVTRAGFDVQIFHRGIVLTDDPATDVGKRWLLFTNQDKYLAFDPGTLLCTSMDCDPVDTFSSPQKWRVQLTLTGRWEGWMPWAWWIDSKTGEAPDDLAYGTGYKPIQLYSAINYATTWPLNGVIANPGPANITPPGYYDLNMWLEHWGWIA